MLVQEVDAARTTATEAIKAATQAKLDATRHAAGSSTGFTKGPQGILESKAISNLPVLGNERGRVPELERPHGQRGKPSTSGQQVSV